VLVLRTVRGGDHGSFVPNFSVTLGVALSLASVAALVYFIHHVSFSLQAPQLVAMVAGELRRSRERVYPGRSGPAGGRARTRSGISPRTSRPRREPWPVAAAATCRRSTSPP
jgi:uncharacterized membrane protein